MQGIITYYLYIMTYNNWNSIFRIGITYNN